MGIHTHVKVKLLLSPRQSRGITYWIYCVFLNKQVAIPIYSPEWIVHTKRDAAFSPVGLTKLRGWTRFDDKESSADEKLVISLYQRWWGNGRTHIHPLLLWLQRESVAEFEGSPVAGRDDDTPYDYDHICPADHWGNWRGDKGSDRLIDFLIKGDGEGHRHVGNSIGNMRVWQSERNRSDGADSPSKKLELELEFSDARASLLAQSAIDESQILGWVACSGERRWSELRAQAFQQVVEQRAFSLYKSFYGKLDFSKWSEK